MECYSKWFCTNGYYRFHPGDVLKIKHRNACGFGVDSSILILGSITDKNQDYYDSFHRSLAYDEKKWKDKAFDYFTWMDGQSIPNDLQVYKSKRAKHFKCNVEMHYKKIGNIPIEQAKNFNEIQANIAIENLRRG